jgi:hypothetical protein
MDRSVNDYLNSPWESFSATPQAPVRPHWPLHADGIFTTLNVDGGVTDNDPFQLAHDFLATQNPLAKMNLQTGDLENPRSPEQANCAVLTIAPFPANALFNPNFDFDSAASVAGMLPRLLTVLISQSRFLGESLTAVMTGSSYSRFVLAPSDADNPAKNALQCGLLSAFGGFFERGFRAHDYQLGRRNCQKFLRDHFRLSVTNPIIAAGLSKYDEPTRTKIIDALDPHQHGYIPIIPLCGTAVAEVPALPRATITSTRVGHIVNWIVDRLHALTKPLLGSVIDSEFEAWAARSALDTLISTWGRGKIREILLKELDGLVVD